MTDNKGGRPKRIASPLIVKCARCGIPREVNRNRPGTGLCRDCRSVLAPSEREAWAA